MQAVCCNPSRTSFLTGLRPLTSRVWNNRQVMSQRLPAGTVTLPELLKKKGFYTAVIGKFFHTVEYAEKQLRAFDRIESHGKPPGWEGPGPILKFPPVKRVQRDPAPKDPKSKAYRQWRARNSDRYGDSGLTPEEEGDYRNAQIACALLKEFAQTKKQFFLSVHQSRPHTPLIAPKKYIDMHDPAQVPEPPAPPNAQTSLYPRRVTVGNPDIFMNRQPTRQEVKEAIAAYLEEGGVPGGERDEPGRADPPVQLPGAWQRAGARSAVRSGEGPVGDGESGGRSGLCEYPAGDGPSAEGRLEGRIARSGGLQVDAMRATVRSGCHRR
ncbi:MAG: sulfatase-like hydrolase/transferase [Planctomycetes bacterium]|nr:sulfatase-like hydrolase/transferase [Planctomycetota bacterium]